MSRINNHSILVFLLLGLSACAGGDDPASSGSGTNGVTDIGTTTGNLFISGLDFGTGRTATPTGVRVDTTIPTVTNYLIHNEPPGYPETFTANYDNYSVGLFYINGVLGAVQFNYFNSGNDPLATPDGYNYQLDCNPQIQCNGVVLSNNSVSFTDVKIPVLNNPQIPNFATGEATLNGTVSW